MAPQLADRTEKSIRNLVFGVFTQLIGVAFTMIVRKVVVSRLGIEYAGLNGLFNEIIAIMALSELGIGAAITFAMYKPLAQKDTQKLAALMRLFKKAYIAIFFVLTAAGLVLTPFVHLLVRDIDIPLYYQRIVFIIFVLKTSLSYLFSYKTALINADQKMYVISVVNMIGNILSSITSLLIIIRTSSFILYLLSQIAFIMAQNIALSIYADRHYPFLKDKNTLELSKTERDDIFKDIKNLFVGKLSGKITNSTDNILISLLSGTVAVGLYTNYSMVLNAVLGLALNLQTSLNASIGDMMACDPSDKCEEVLRRLSFIVGLIGCTGGVCMYALLSPLVSLWLGEQYLLGAPVVFVLAVNFFFSVARIPLWGFMQNSGLFQYDRNISIAGSAVNLVVSLLAGLRFGIIGVFIGTTCTHVIQIVLKIILLYRRRFQLAWGRYLLNWTLWTALTVALALLCSFICSFINLPNAYLSFALKLIVTPSVTLAAIFFLFNRTPDFKYLLWLIKKTLHIAK